MSDLTDLNRYHDILDTILNAVQRVYQTELIESEDPARAQVEAKKFLIHLQCFIADASVRRMDLVKIMREYE